MSLIAFAIRKPVSIVMITVGTVILGLISLWHLPIDLFPDVDFPVLTITTRLSGYSPVHIETLITKPIEEVASTVNNVESVKSLSKEGESEVHVAFKLGTNMDFASLQVRERIDLIKGDFPRDTEHTIISKRNPSSNPILVLTAFGEAGPAKLREVADDLIKKRLERIEGVANVEVGGGKEREIVVDVEEAALKSLGISVTEMAEVIRKNNQNLPIGSVVRGSSELAARTIGEVRSLKEIEEIPLLRTQNGSVLRVKDVGEVRDDFKESESIALFKGEPRVSITLQKESDANTLQIADAVEKEIRRMKPDFPRGVNLEVFFSQADDIRSSLRRLKEAIFLGGALAMGVLFVFLWHLSSTLIIGIAIPISVMTTFSLMYFFGITLNVISMSGLALGIGMLVDNSIVVLENIFRHQRRGSPAPEAAALGAREVLTAIAASTFAHIAVFFPLVFVQKKVQMLYSGLFYTVSFSLLVSLGVAVTLVPMLSSWIPSRPKQESAARRRSLQIYRRGLRAALRYRGIVAVSFLVLFGASLYLIKFIGFEGMGAMERGEFRMLVQTPPGTRPAVVQRVTGEIEAILYQVPDVADVSTEITGDSAKLFARLKKEGIRKSTREVVETVRPKVRAIPRAQVSFSIDRVSGKGHSIALEVHGFEPKKLLAHVLGIRKKLMELKGVSDVIVRQANEKPEIQVRVLHDKAGVTGLSATVIAHAIRSAFTGPISTTYRDRGKEIDLRVRIRPGDRPDVRSLPYLLAIEPKDRARIPLGEFCTFEEGYGPGEIHRKDQQRIVEIQAEISGEMDIQQAASLIEKELSDLRFDEGYGYTFGEDYQELKTSQRELIFAVILAVVLVYMILASLFESLLYPFAIMFSVPLAAMGVLWTFFATGKPMSVGVYVGGIALAGIVVNNAIVLVDFIKLLGEKGVGRWRAILWAGEMRLRPILMTSATTILGLLPMALDRSVEAALWSPLALTIISGLAVSTVLTLFVVPVAYSLLEDLRRWTMRPSR
jgi:HAE1 family hydrophobic/amphiphilic exporter-1